MKRRMKRQFTEVPIRMRLPLLGKERHEFRGLLFLSRRGRR